MRDWRLIFTNSYRNPEMQKVIDKEFNGKPRMKVSKEQLETLVVQCCAMMMEKQEKDGAVV